VYKQLIREIERKAHVYLVVSLYLYILCLSMHACACACQRPLIMRKVHSWVVLLSLSACSYYTWPNQWPLNARDIVFTTVLFCFRVSATGQQKEKAEGEHVGSRQQRTSCTQKKITWTKFFSSVAGAFLNYFLTFRNVQCVTKKQVLIDISLSFSSPPSLSTAI